MTRLEFNNQVLQLSRKLYMVAFRFLRNQEEAEDTVQEAFIRLWNRREDLERYESIEALAVTTTKNLCIDAIRKKKPFSIEDQQGKLFIPDYSPSADEVMIISETNDLLNKIIDNLPEIYRQIIYWKEIDCLDYEEIAELSGQNINTLRVNLSRARKLIRDEFKKYKYEYSGNSRPA
ncbi:MAG: RNA polymerase sigma factor [Bacteroidales bacterium]